MKKYLQPLYFLVISLIFTIQFFDSPDLFGQDKKGVYSIQELVARALSVYTPAKLAELKIKESEYERKAQTAWENPHLGFEYGRKEADGTWGNAFTVSLNQQFSFPGKIGVIDEIQRFEENKAKLTSRELQLFIRYEVTRLSYEYAKTLYHTKHIRDRLGRLRLINTYMRGRILVSPQRIVEKSIIESRISLLEKEMLEVNQKLQVAFSKLNIYVNLEDKVLPKVNVSWFASIPTLNESEIIEKACKSSFAVRMQKEEIKRAGYAARQAGQKILPDIGVSVFYSREEAGSKEQMFGAGVSIPIPIISWNRDAVKKGKMREKIEKGTLQNKQIQIKQQMRKLFNQYRSAGVMLKKFPMSRIKRLERTMRYADREFRKGRVQLQTYLDMDNQIHEMIEAVVETQLDVVNIYTAILFLAAETKEINGDTP